jgi:hypothetical protein
MGIDESLFGLLDKENKRFSTVLISRCCLKRVNVERKSKEEGKQKLFHLPDFLTLDFSFENRAGMAHGVVGWNSAFESK